MIVSLELANEKGPPFWKNLCEVRKTYPAVQNPFGRDVRLSTIPTKIRDTVATFDRGTFRYDWWSIAARYVREQCQISPHFSARPTSWFYISIPAWSGLC